MSLVYYISFVEWILKNSQQHIVCQIYFIPVMPGTALFNAVHIAVFSKQRWLVF